MCFYLLYTFNKVIHTNTKKRHVLLVIQTRNTTCVVCSISLNHNCTMVFALFSIIFPQLSQSYNWEKCSHPTVLTVITCRQVLVHRFGLWRNIFCFASLYRCALTTNWLSSLPQDIMCPMTMASSTSSVMWPTKGRSGGPARLSSFVPTAPQRMSYLLWRMNATLTSWWSPPRLASLRYDSTSKYISVFRSY